MTGRETGGEEEGGGQAGIEASFPNLSHTWATGDGPRHRGKKRWMAIFCGGEVWVEGRRGMAKVVPSSQVSGHRKRWGWAHKRKKEREGDEWKEKEERGKGFRRKKSLIRLSD